ncbi:thymus-specific serine protease-like [Elephas maximus indicus]|uniref:thymus-specific serine protease-like n=1 Tax=Elephas maximus indicus TaxID=99487 RepID=UPI002116F207|nr:thymus-specific serine protease-like [Elephas maximus indicus]
MSTENFRRYLSSRQAVADIAEFRTVIAQSMNLTENKWVLFGGSYGGSLAVWSRIKHPNLFAAAVTSSAMVQAKVNFYEYFEVIHRALATHNRECLKAVKQAYGFVAAMLLLPGYHSRLILDYKFCEPLTIKSEMDQLYIIEKLMLICSTIVLSNRKSNTVKHAFETALINQANLTPEVTLFNPNLGEMGEMSIDEFCETMTNTSLGSPYHRYARIINTMISNRRYRCYPASYKQFVEEYSNTSMERNKYRRGRQWLYQTCSEFGWFYTPDLKNSSFSGLPTRYFVKRCSDVFGPKFNNHSVFQGVMSTNKYYGGLNVRGSKIIFSNGSNDPWHRLGITKDISADLPAVFIKGEAFCEDMAEPQDTDSAELKQAREKIFQTLKKWLRK